MSGGVVAAFVGTAILVVINIAIAAFSYGRLSQKVDDCCRRITRLENTANGNGKAGKQQA